MKPNLQTILKQAGTTTALLGGAIASCYFGSPLFASVIGGVLTNILSNKVEQSQLLKIREILSRQNPSNLNHDLEKLSIEALEWATKNICFNYRAYCSTDVERKELDTLEKRIIKQIKNVNKAQWRASKDFLNQINELNDDNDFINNFQILNENWPPINTEFPFPKFYEDEFVKNYQLCFGELLKDDNHKPALIAYNRNISTQIQKGLLEQKNQIEALLAGNEELKQNLRDLALTPAERFEKEFVLPEIHIKLDEYFKPLQDDVKLLVNMQGEVLTGIGVLQKESKHQTKQLSDLSGKTDKLLRNRLGLLLLPLIALLLAFFAYRYWQSTQPFIYTVQVQNTSKNSILPYENADVSFIYQGKTETQNAEKEAVFRNLPSSLRGDSARIKITSHGFYTIDTLVVLDGNHISLNLNRDDTYQYMIGQVKDTITGVGIAGAYVMVLDIRTSTDHNGNYKLKIPEEKQNTEHRLKVSKTGYRDWNRIEPVIFNSESIISLEK